MLLDQLLEICEFKRFPFEFRPTQTPEIWAGDQKVLRELRHFRDNVMANGLAEFGVISGTYGSGKSHSLLHLRHLVEEFKTDVPSATVYIENPCALGVKGKFSEVYRYIVSQGFGREKVVQMCSHARSALVTQAFEKLTPSERSIALTDKTKLNQVARGIYQEVTVNSPITFGALGALADNEEDAWNWLTDQDIVSMLGNDSVQLLESHLVCAKALATLVRLGTLRHPGQTPAFHSVFFLVDQTEDLANLKPGPFQEQITGWRTLLDEVNSNFGMLWAMDGSSEDIAAEFTEAISRRVTTDPERLRLLPLSGNEPLAFLKEVMKFFRTDNATVSDVYPFDDDALNQLINSTPEKQPSFLLIAARKVLTKAANQDLIKKRGDILTAADVTSCLS